MSLRAQDAQQGVGEKKETATISALLGELCHPEPRVKWKAVKELGQTVANLAAKDVETARNVMRRLMWSLNDESGGIGWGAPEAMAEIMAQETTLAQEFAHVLVSFLSPEGNYLEFPPLQRGAVWGVGRLAQIHPHLVQDAEPYLLEFLSSSDPELRGLSAWALGNLSAKKAKSGLARLLSDKSQLTLWEEEQLVSRSVGELSKKALARLESSDSGKSSPAQGGDQKTKPSLSSRPRR